MSNDAVVVVAVAVSVVETAFRVLSLANSEAKFDNSSDASVNVNTYSFLIVLGRGWDRYKKLPPASGNGGKVSG